MENNGGVKLVKTEQWWFKEPECEDLVKRIWQKEVHGIHTFWSSNQALNSR